MRDLFDQATNLPTDERRTFVDRVGADDHELRDELRSLIESDKCQIKKPITDAIGNAISGTIDERRQRLVGKKVGDYNLLRVIGHGGVGTVYLGRHSESQPGALAAIKIVERAALHDDTRRRFQIEKQILADLDHPNIARIFDAGDTDEGLPYLVMEHVQGDSIDRYCDKRRLNIRSRLQLFLQVCDALQYAHSRLVIHRDLKPANILITLDGTVKLLDFGIAKLLDSTTGSAIALTRMQDQLLTPEYASPEQIQGQYLTTGSDIYSLGVLLHELLTGSRPYGTPLTQLELEKAICLEEPRRPSRTTRSPRSNVLLGAEECARIQMYAALRGTTPPKLHDQLRGDLDAIVLRALRKDPKDRYQSVEELVDDIRSHVALRPVSAVRFTRSYLTTRLARRHAIPIVIGLGIAMTFGLAIIEIARRSAFVAIERDRAIATKRAADTATEFMVSVFETDTPSIENTDTALELLTRAATKIQVNDIQDPEIKAKLLESIGIGQTRLGRSLDGLIHVREALSIRHRLNEPDSPELANLHINIAKAEANIGDLANARHSLAAAVELLINSGDLDSAMHAEVLYRTAGIELSSGNIETSLQLLSESKRLFEKHRGPTNPAIGSVLKATAEAHSWLGNHQTANDLMLAAMKMHELTLPEMDPDRVATQSYLGITQLHTGNLADGKRNIEDAYVKAIAIFGNDSARVFDQTVDLADMHRALEEYSLAETHQRRAMQLCSKHFDSQSHLCAQVGATLGIILWKLGRLEESMLEFRQSLDIYKKQLPPDHLYISAVEHFMAENLISQMKDNQAEQQASIALKRLIRANAATWRIGRTENTLGYVEYRLSRSNALNRMERSYAKLSTAEAFDRTAVTLARDRLREVYLATGNTEKLQALDASIKSEKSKAPTRL